MRTKLEYPKRLFCLLAQQVKPTLEPEFLNVSASLGGLEESSFPGPSNKLVAVYELKEKGLFEGVVSKFGYE